MSRLRRRLRAETGYSLVELVTVLASLGVVLSALASLMVASMDAEVDMNNRFQAQQQARLAVDRLRREVHSAQSIAPAGASPTVTLTFPGGAQVTWCTVADGGHFGLWRYAGGACSGTGVRVADHLTQASVFTYAVPAAGSGLLHRLAVTLPVDADTSDSRQAYTLSDAIALRNSPRA